MAHTLCGYRLIAREHDSIVVSFHTNFTKHVIANEMVM